MDDGDPKAVAEACEAAVSLASDGGLDVVSARSITIDFADDGDVTVTVVSAEGVADSGTITAADMASWNDDDTEETTTDE